MPLEKADITKLRGRRMEAADELHGEGPRRQDRPLRAALPADELRRRRRSTRSSTTRIRDRRAGRVGTRAFAAAAVDHQALAELGFVVITLDGMGTPGRSKSFHDAYYGDMGRDNTLPDQVAGMKELATRFPWIDIDRAAMWGHSGGGFITAGAMFRYPDFFKVGISESGNHDQRVYEDDWGERYQGLLHRLGGAHEGGDEPRDNYEAEANQTMAKNLKGKLLLMHGMMDDNVPPQNTYLVIDALIKANKDFDLILLPSASGTASASTART